MKCLPRCATYALAFLLAACGGGDRTTDSLKSPAGSLDNRKASLEVTANSLPPVRFATFHASLNRNNAGDLIRDLSAPGNAQAAAIAEIIQRVRPDVLLINEFDFDAGGTAARLFQDNYLGVSQGGAEPIVYGYRFVAPSNSGIPSGFDLDNNGSVGGGNDAFGFGNFPGQFGMVVYSRYPIDYERVRTFRNFLWKDMPGARLPADPLDSDRNGDTSSFYSAAERDVLRLSSKSHWDVPILIPAAVGGASPRVVHFLVSHPTPPTFDGPEDRNGTRNFDEIRFWADYLQPRTSGYIYDDKRVRGGLPAGARFVIAGDLNRDPVDGDGVAGAMQQLLEHPLVNTSMTPASVGGPEQALLQSGVNAAHRGDPAFDTADLGDFGNNPGNLRLDYVLPERSMQIQAAGVFWPARNDPLFRLVGTFPFPSSDHRLVWIDVRVPSVGETLAQNIACAKGLVDQLQPGQVGPGQRPLMSSLLSSALAYQSSHPSLALSLVNAAIVRTDGCPLRTTPDTIITQGGGGVDFVTDCAAQAPIYACLKDAQTQLQTNLAMRRSTR